MPTGSKDTRKIDNLEATSIKIQCPKIVKRDATIPYKLLTKSISVETNSGTQIRRIEEESFPD